MRWFSLHHQGGPVSDGHLRNRAWGETAIWVFISLAGRPEGEEADEEIVEAFEETNPGRHQAAVRRGQGAR